MEIKKKQKNFKWNNPKNKKKPKIAVKMRREIQDLKNIRQIGSQKKKKNQK